VGLVDAGTLEIVARYSAGNRPWGVTLLRPLTEDGPWRYSLTELALKRILSLAAVTSALAASLILGSLQAAGAPGGLGGETLFRQRCAVCHSVDPGKQTPLGPNLRGVGGRKAGAAAFNYSPQLKQSGLTWTAVELDRFLAAPTRVVPGTRMPMGVPNAAERAALVDYLSAAR
jgi:cytochrome c